MDTNLCISVNKISPPYSLAVLSSVKFKVTDLTTVFTQFHQSAVEENKIKAIENFFSVMKQ